MLPKPAAPLKGRCPTRASEHTQRSSLLPRSHSVPVPRNTKGHKDKAQQPLQDPPTSPSGTQRLLILCHCHRPPHLLLHLPCARPVSTRRSEPANVGLNWHRGLAQTSCAGTQTPCQQQFPIMAGRKTQKEADTLSLSGALKALCLVKGAPAWERGILPALHR